jgi:hypothetical protein
MTRDLRRAPGSMLCVSSLEASFCDTRLVSSEPCLATAEWRSYTSTVHARRVQGTLQLKLQLHGPRPTRQVSQTGARSTHRSEVTSPTGHHPVREPSQRSSGREGLLITRPCGAAGSGPALLGVHRAWLHASGLMRPVPDRHHAGHVILTFRGSGYAGKGGPCISLCAVKSYLI